MQTGYPSIDKPWLKYYGNDVKNIEMKEESIFQMLERCSQNKLDSVALELRTSVNDYADGIKITYEQYLQRIKEAAKALSALGIQKNEIVPLILPNVPESRILIYALNLIGATAYPISPMISSVVFQNIIKDNSVRVIAIFGTFWQKFSEDIKNSDIEHVLYLNGLESASVQIQFAAKIKDKFSQSEMLSVPKDSRIITWNRFVALTKKQTDNILPYFEKDHIAAIIGTSGTTGTSKGVCLTDANLNSLAVSQEASDDYHAGRIALDILIQSIGYGISTMHSFGCIGLHTVLIPELVTNGLPQLICKIKPDCFLGGPVHYINIVRSQEFAKEKVPYVRLAYSGGASLGKEIETKLNNVSEGHVESNTDMIRVRQGYGSTECCGAATANVTGAYKFGSIGIPMVNVTVSIFKPGTDIECPYGEEGEICVSGPTVMKGYLDNPEETENVLKLHSDGQIWLHQADLGWCDSDGHFFLTDRIKNIFMRTGFNVHPSKIAEFIASLTGVNECSVVGVPHPDEQMVPVAFVVLDNDRFTNVDDATKALKQECIKNLSETDIPFEWFFVDDLPRNMGGKIDTQMLIQMCNVNYMK